MLVMLRSIALLLLTTFLLLTNREWQVILRLSSRYELSHMTPFQLVAFALQFVNDQSLLWKLYQKCMFILMSETQVTS